MLRVFAPPVASGCSAPVPPCVCGELDAVLPLSGVPVDGCAFWLSSVVLCDAAVLIWLPVAFVCVPADRVAVAAVLVLVAVSPLVFVSVWVAISVWVAVSLFVS